MTDTIRTTEPFDFDRPFVVYDWKTDRQFAVLDTFVGMSLMLRSSRFDYDHLTASVRVLNNRDADRLGIPHGTPVIFKQEKRKALYVPCRPSNLYHPRSRLESRS